MFFSWHLLDQQEHAARAQAIENSKEEVADLKSQVEADEKLIPEVKKALEDKKSQFDERSTYRLGELKAIGEAITLLTDDANRDMFSSSFSFLQLSQSQSASKALSSAYSASQDGRVTALMALLHQQDSSGAFETVVAKINDMIALLKKEDADDLKKKDTCVANKAKDEASQKKFERSVEDLETTVSFNEAKLKEITGQIEGKKAEIADVEAQLSKAADVRAAEKAEFTKATADDKAAVGLLKEAANKISSFYKKASLAQMKTNTELSGAPKTWEGSYGGAGTQSTGVVHMMEVLMGDLEKETEVATKEEAEAEEVFQDSKKDLETAKAGLESAIDQLAKGKGEVDSDKEDATAEMKLKKQSLTALLEKMKDIEPECNYYIVNFAKRSKNRMTEINGLAQAKAILEGSSWGFAHIEWGIRLRGAKRSARIATSGHRQITFHILQDAYLSLTRSTLIYLSLFALTILGMFPPVSRVHTPLLLRNIRSSGSTWKDCIWCRAKQRRTSWAAWPSFGNTLAEWDHVRPCGTTGTMPVTTLILAETPSALYSLDDFQ